MIGKLVTYKESSWGCEFFGIGIILDHRHTGRFRPSIELKVHFPNSQDPKRSVMHPNIKNVVFLDEEMNQHLRR